MDSAGSAVGRGPPGIEGSGSEWAAFIQQQIQSVFQAAVPHMVQQISELAVVRPLPASPSVATQTIDLGYERAKSSESMGVDNKESKVAPLEKFSGKKRGEVYRWFPQLRLVFCGKPQSYRLDEDKVAFALSYMTGAAQNWAMPILQALDEGRHYELLTNYDAFRDAVIAVHGELDRRSTAEDCLGRIRQTGSMASYIRHSMSMQYKLNGMKQV